MPHTQAGGALAAPPLLASPAADTLIREDAVRARLNVSRATLARWLAARRMPQPIRLGGGRTRRWRQSEIDDWIAAGCPDLSA